MSSSPRAEDDRTVLIDGSSAGQASAPEPSTAGHNALEIGTRIAEFEIIGIVGVGGFGIVYLAEDHSLGRRVAVKEYMPAEFAHRIGPANVSVKSRRHAEMFQKGMESFIKEARLLAQFDHPSLVKVYRFWEANGTAYMAMPYYEGRTFKDAIGQLGHPPDESWLKWLLAQLLDALEIIHKQQCFHRDIAPDNILILEDERPLLLDFGAARRVIGDMTQAITVILKPGYAPIEQYAEVPNMRQGAWTDLYALASVIYFAITGQAPTPAVARVMSDPLVPLTTSVAGRYSAAFLAAIDAALAFKPEERPQSVADFRRLLGLSTAIPASRMLPASGEMAGVENTTLQPASKQHHAVQAQASRVREESHAKNRPMLLLGGAVLCVALIAAYVAYIVFDEPAAPDTKPSKAKDVAAVVAHDPQEDLQQRLGRLDCARLASTLAGGIATLRGYVGTEADLQRLPNELASVKGVQQVEHSAVSVMPSAYCGVMSRLAPYVSFHNDAPRVSLKGGGAVAKAGDKLVAEVVGPGFDSYVYVDLYDPEGNVAHLLPNAKERKNLLKPRQSLTLGDDPVFGQQWDVIPPLGKHLLVVVASHAPLFDKSRREAEESMSYVQALTEGARRNAGQEPPVVQYAVVDFVAKR